MFMISIIVRHSMVHIISIIMVVVVVVVVVVIIGVVLGVFGEISFVRRFIKGAILFVKTIDRNL